MISDLTALNCVQQPAVPLTVSVAVIQLKRSGWISPKWDHFDSVKMAASFLRLGRAGSLKCLQLGTLGTLRRAPAATLTTKPGGPKKPDKKTNITRLDPIQKLFLDKIREYATKSKSSGGLVDAGPEYQKNLSEEMTKLQRLYGGGDLTKFPEFKFPEPKLDEVAPK
ncbi:hypothetical protein COCON_G00047460 [Conger conger]|uniref:ATP synthase peripheral stalk subunit F6, mitochondrial n=1 Tax=Conger conger TaxID=82655 RepID=A0A9Q1DUT3_CONCO|nr:hypothetical protein COCON_G00047460 [Conger conger]